MPDKDNAQSAAMLGKTLYVQVKGEDVPAIARKFYETVDKCGMCASPASADDPIVALGAFEVERIDETAGRWVLLGLCARCKAKAESESDAARKIIQEKVDRIVEARPVNKDAADAN